MFRIDTDGSDSGQFRDGNPSTGQEGTVLSAEYLNEMQETIAKAIELAGIALSKGDPTQLYDAMMAIALGVAGAGSGPGSVPTTRLVATTGLLSGGGDLTADRTLTLPAASAADVVAGMRSDAAITPLALAGAYASTVGAEIDLHFPGGLILKFGGTGAYTTEGQVPHDFVTAFPNNCFRVIPTGINATANINRDIWPQVVSKSKTGCIFYAQWTGNGGTINSLDGIDFVSIGN
ncbi:hypothetical protein BH10PSE14_BH10PSE14_29910 [soil metagenome]